LLSFEQCLLKTHHLVGIHSTTAGLLAVQEGYEHELDQTKDAQ
jgi:hypothetical protein